jgi:ABC-type transport system involved in multi-copper enzyme maturation permease subunit
MGAIAAASDRVHLWSPVLVKELRTRMRGARPAWLQAGYVFAMLVVMAATYAAEVGSGTVQVRPGLQVGHTLYVALFIVQAVLVALIVPGLTAGAISGEQEQKTYEMLAGTRLRSRQVVAGKLLGAWLFAVLLLTTSLPLAALCLLFGGVSPAEVMWSYGLIALFALLLASVGLWWSSAVPRSLVAVIGAYGTMGALMAVTAAVMYRPMTFTRGYPGPSIFAAVNPVAAVFYAANALPLYGWAVPTGVASAALFIIASALFAAAASQRLPLFGRRRGIFVRGLMLLLFSAITFLAAGDCGQAIRAGLGLNSTRGFLAISACCVMTLLMALAPVLAAGELAQPLAGGFIGWLAGGLSPRRLLQPDVRSAFPFLALMTLVALGVILGAVLYFGQVPGVPLWLPAYWRLLALSLATAFGCSMLGLWAALRMPGLRGRAALSVVIVVGYLMTHLIVATAPAGPHLLSVQLAYLNPSLIALTYARHLAYPALLRLQGAAGLGIGATAAVLFLIIGIVGLFGAHAAFKRQLPAEVTSNE